MTDDDSGFSLSEAIETGKNATRQFTTFLGIRQEQFQCPDCQQPCTETTTYNPDTAAFDGGACPAWECPECGKQYHREPDDSMTTLDLYGRGL